MELPQYTDYDKISRMNPFAGWLAMEQADLAKTFQQEKLAQEQEATRTKNLANIFSEQQNPQLIEQQRQLNLQRRYEMPAKKLAGEIAEKTGPDQMKAAIQDWAGKVTQGELDSMYREGQRMALSGKTPEERQAGIDIMNMTPEFLKLKTQHEQRMREGERRDAAAMARTQATIASQEKRLTTPRPGKGPLSLAEKLAGAKTAFHKSNIYAGEAVTAEAAGDTEKAQYYLEQAEIARQEDIRQREAAAMAALGGKIDLEALQKEGVLRYRRDVEEGKAPPPSVVRKTPPPALPPGWIMK